MLHVRNDVLNKAMITCIYQITQEDKSEENKNSYHELIKAFICIFSFFLVHVVIHGCYAPPPKHILSNVNQTICSAGSPLFHIGVKVGDNTGVAGLIGMLRLRKQCTDERSVCMTDFTVFLPI